MVVLSSFTIRHPCDSASAVHVKVRSHIQFTVRSPIDPVSTTQVGRMVKCSHSPTFHSIFKLYLIYFIVLTIQFSSNCDENMTLIDFEMMIRFDFEHSTFVFTRYNFCCKRVDRKNRMENRTENRIVWPHFYLYRFVYFISLVVDILIPIYLSL